MKIGNSSTLNDVDKALQGVWDSTQQYLSLGKVRIWFVKPPATVKYYKAEDIYIERL